MVKSSVDIEERNRRESGAVAVLDTVSGYQSAIRRGAAVYAIGAKRAACAIVGDSGDSAIDRFRRTAQGTPRYR